VFHRGIFLSNDEKLGWDGSWNGKVLNPGVFTWVAIIKLINGESVTLSGEINLLN
jgi:hypothetical protein